MKGYLESYYKNPTLAQLLVCAEMFENLGDNQLKEHILHPSRLLKAHQQVRESGVKAINCSSVLSVEQTRIRSVRGQREGWH